MEVKVRKMPLYKLWRDVGRTPCYMSKIYIHYAEMSSGKPNKLSISNLKDTRLHCRNYYTFISIEPKY